MAKVTELYDTFNGTTLSALWTPGAAVVHVAGGMLTQTGEGATGAVSVASYDCSGSELIWRAPTPQEAWDAWRSANGGYNVTAVSSWIQVGSTQIMIAPGLPGTSTTYFQVDPGFFSGAISTTASWARATFSAGSNSAMHIYASLDGSAWDHVSGPHTVGDVRAVQVKTFVKWSDNTGSSFWSQIGLPPVAGGEAPWAVGALAF